MSRISPGAQITVTVTVPRLPLHGKRPSESYPMPPERVADRLSTEALLQLFQNLRFRDPVEFVMQRRLKHVHVKNAIAQTDRTGMRGDKLRVLLVVRRAEVYSRVTLSLPV